MSDILENCKKYSAKEVNANLTDKGDKTHVLETSDSFSTYFYNIDGFRYAFIGQSDSSLLIGGFFLLILNIILVYLTYLMFRSGYKLKS